MSQEKAAVNLTESAVRRLEHLVEAKGEGALGIRLGIKTAGCSGLTYKLDFAREERPGEEVVEAGSTRIFVEPEAVMLLHGTQMDFVEDRLGASFVFNNPNEKARCGCGESFTV